MALKVACYPGDERFQREVVLLSRVHHPSVPRLLGQGQWEPPRGEAHPFIVMEWVEGLALYTWAEWCNASSHQVLQVLGQLAGAVAATHAAGGVHRDIKGGNIRVSLEGARAVLMDFGADTYAGAAPLTKGALPPGTEGYRSPEALEYALQRPRGSTETYAAQPADDVFALGVCAYQLVTGWYLPPVEVEPGEEGPWHMVWRAPRPPAEMKPPTANAKDSSGSGPASRPVPQTPLDDQRREPHCYPPAEVTIHGGCWVEVPSVKPPCKEPFYEWQGSCYVPSLIRRRKPTSDPQ